MTNKEFELVETANDIRALCEALDSLPVEVTYTHNNNKEAVDAAESLFYMLVEKADKMVDLIYNAFRDGVIKEPPTPTEDTATEREEATE